MGARGRFFRVSLGRDVITIASALTPDGCDVIASLPKAITPPILHTRYSILSRTVCTFALSARLQSKLSPL
jgi:hypothetical protein